MVDNERLDASKADDVQRETKTPLACYSSPCSAFTQIQTAQLGTRDAEVNDQSDGVIDSEEDKSTSVATVDSSDVLRQIVIDGSNIAMRFEFYSFSSEHYDILSNRSLYCTLRQIRLFVTCISCEQTADFYRAMLYIARTML